MKTFKGQAENQNRLWNWFKQGLITEEEFRRQESMLKWVKEQKQTTIQGEW